MLLPIKKEKANTQIWWWWA